MTVPELISNVLTQLENQFYCDLPRRDFKRDEPMLIRAIGTYGHECNQRAWEFDVPFIYGEFCRLIKSFKQAGTAITYMPLYLQIAIRQHIREHADQLNSQAKSFRVSLCAPERGIKGELSKKSAIPSARLVPDIVAGVKVVTAVRESTPVEMLGSVYGDVRKLRRKASADRRAATAATKKQPNLL